MQSSLQQIFCHRQRHDELACAILVTTSMELAEKVSKLTEEFIAGLSRKEILQKSIDNYGYILVADSMDDAVDVVNEIAPEHLEIQTINPFETMTQVRNAGAIFMGEYSSEPLGDYFAGPNHVLPTNGTGKVFLTAWRRCLCKEIKYYLLLKEGIKASQQGYYSVCRKRILDSAC